MTICLIQKIYSRAVGQNESNLCLLSFFPPNYSKFLETFRNLGKAQAVS